MAPSKKNSTPSDEVTLYDKLIATIPAIERKGAANPYTALNGNMFTLLHQSRLAIRLPEKERAAFLKKYKTKLFEVVGYFDFSSAGKRSRVLSSRSFNSFTSRMNLG